MRQKLSKKGNLAPAVKAHDAELKAETEQFFVDHGTTIIKNESELVRRGVRYFMRDFKRSGGYMDPDGFPIVSDHTSPKAPKTSK